MTDMPAGFGPATENDPRLLTADGVKITDKARLFNYYDCEWVTVHFDNGSQTRSPSGQYWDGWFDVMPEEGGKRSGRYSLNGERMSSVVPAWYVRKNS